MSDINIGTLAGKIELEDKISSTFDILVGKIDRLDERFGALHGGVVHAAEGFFLGELAMKAFERGLDLVTDLVKDFTVEGAGIADVEQNFRRLTEGAGQLGETLLGTLRAGTHNTITDFELMKSVNDNLAAGVKLTDDQYKAMAEGGFALAQAKGRSVKDVFDAINEALTTGNVRQLKYYTGKVDLANAELDYAVALGKTTAQLSEAEKAEADRLAIINAVTEATGRLGEQTDGLDEIFAQAQTFAKNFYEDLIKSAASSPSVIAAFTTIRDTIVSAFGGDSQGLLETFLSWINDTADAVTQYAPVVIHGLVDIKDWIVSFYTASVDAWHTYGPVIVQGFTMIKDFVLGVYHAVIDSWQALPDWLKTVAEKSALTAAGLYVIGSAAKSAGSGITDVIGTIGNLTTTFSGMPVALGNISSALGSVRLLAGLTTLEFTSMAAARTSIGLLAGSVTAMIGPLGVATVYAGLLYAAFELGKWQPVSDFFQNLGLKIMGYTEAQRAAMIATDHQTQAQAAAAKTAEDANKVHDQAKAIMDALAKAQTEAADAAKKHADEEKNLNDQMNAADREKYIQSWQKLTALGVDYKQVLDELQPAMRQDVIYFAQLGASAEDLIAAFPRLGKAQAEAAVIGGAAVRELRQVYADTFEIITKAHGNNIEDWIKGEKTKFDISMEGLRLEGKLTDERFEAETAKFNAMIEAEMHGRAEQVKGSRAEREKEYEDAKNTLDLMLRDSKDFSDEDIRQARQVVTEKARLLNQWRGSDHEALQAHHDEVKNIYDDEIARIERLNNAFRDLHETMAGGSHDVTSQDFESSLRSMITSGGANPSGQGSNIDLGQAYRYAGQGYSFQEIVDIFNRQRNGGTGAVPPPQGPRIPGFKEGGYGDFGEGTIAMLHDEEAIIPKEKFITAHDIDVGQLSDFLMDRIEHGSTFAEVGDATNFTAAEVKKMYENLAANGGRDGDNITIHVNGTAEDAAHKIADILMNRARKTRYFGTA
jgi:hypothetical protein